MISTSTRFPVYAGMTDSELLWLFLVVGVLFLGLAITGFMILARWRSKYNFLPSLAFFVAASGVFTLGIIQPQIQKKIDELSYAIELQDYVHEKYEILLPDEAALAIVDKTRPDLSLSEMKKILREYLSSKG